MKRILFAGLVATVVSLALPAMALDHGSQIAGAMIMNDGTGYGVDVTEYWRQGSFLISAGVMVNLSDPQGNNQGRIGLGYILSRPDFEVYGAGGGIKRSGLEDQDGGYVEGGVLFPFGKIPLPLSEVRYGAYEAPRKSQTWLMVGYRYAWWSSTEGEGQPVVGYVSDW